LKKSGEHSGPEKMLSPDLFKKIISWKHQSPRIPGKNREKSRPAKDETPESIIPDEYTTVVSL